MKIYITILASLILTLTNGQNLIPNPSFENYSNCPSFISQINRADNWYSTRMTPDYFNVCAPYGWASVPLNYFGNKMPVSGDAYAGFGGFWQGSSNFPECVGTQLITPLQIGIKYFLSFKVFLGQKANASQWCGINKIGALFSTVPYDTTNTTPLCNCSQIYTNSIITDTINWTTIMGSFVADSIYKYISIGRFFDDVSTNSIQIAGTQCNAYYYLDDICLSNDSLYTAGWTWTTGIENFTNKTSLKMFPNPTSNQFFIESNISEKLNLNIFDVNGKNVLSKIVNDKSNIDVSELNEGVYSLRIKTSEGILNKKLVIVR